MPKRIDDETRAKIVSMYANGRVHREIHEETGVSMGTISDICRAAGLDKYHTGGKIARSMVASPDLPAQKERPEDPITITARVLTMCGIGTGCVYVAGTNKQDVEITLGDWAMSIDRKKLGIFIDELQHVKKMIGVA